MKEEKVEVETGQEANTEGITEIPPEEIIETIRGPPEEITEIPPGRMMEIIPKEGTETFPTGEKTEILPEGMKIPPRVAMGMEEDITRGKVLLNR